MSVSQSALVALMILITLSPMAADMKANSAYVVQGTWSACSATCRNADEKVYKYLMRRCSKYSSCDSDQTSKMECMLSQNSCPVAGQWSDWSQWMKCSQTCGGGEQHRTRDCTNPRAANGGLQCNGHHHELEICNTTPCPVNHVLGSWTAWTTCVECSNLKRYRIRNCTQPLHGGTPCPEVLKQYDNCSYDELSCPVHGGWSTWGPWDDCYLDECSKINVTIKRRRECNNPKPQRTGLDCRGKKDETSECTTWNDTTCPVDGTWSSWSTWLQRPDGKSEDRARSCEGIRNGGNDCPGPSSETQDITDEYTSGGSSYGSGSGSADGSGSDDVYDETEEGSGSERNI